ASLFTRDLGSALTYIPRIEAGLVRVNGDTTGVDPHAPFGGFKGSSSGSREQGPAAREFYTEIKTVQVSGAESSRFPLPASPFPLRPSRFPLSRFPLPASRFPLPAYSISAISFRRRQIGRRNHVVRPLGVPGHRGDPPAPSIAHELDRIDPSLVGLCVGLRV